jgi:arylformamidase
VFILEIPFKGKIIDITTPIAPYTPVFPGDPKPSIERVCTVESEGFAVSRLIFGSHTCTHVDAPSHILDNGLPVDKLELESLMGMALVLNCSPPEEALNGALTAEMLEKALKNVRLSEILSSRNSDNISILLLKTAAHFQKQKSKIDVSSAEDGPGKKNSDLLKENSNQLFLDESAAFWILEKKFKTVGIDSFSVDNYKSESLPVHHILLSNNVNIVECLELSSVESGIFFFLCLPLKVEGCDGSPARALLIDFT